MQGKSGTGGALSMIRLITTFVECHHESVSDNPIDLAAVWCLDRRDGDRKVLIQHPRHFVGLVALGECGKPCKSAKSTLISRFPALVCGR